MRQYALACLVMAIAAAQSAVAEDLPEIPKLTKAEVVNYEWGLTEKSIRDPAQLKSITTFLNENRKGWREAWFGSAPNGSLGLDLFTGTNYYQRYGIGEDFFVCGTLIKDSKQTKDLMQLIGDLPKTLGEVVLPGISNITEIVVMTNITNGAGYKITDPQRINRIAELVNQQRTGWETNWYGEPMLEVMLKLNDKKGFVVEFGAGASFLVRGENEEFMDYLLKHVKKEQTDEILKLVGGP